jgi:type I restriction enzyme M protein
MENHRTDSIPNDSYPVKSDRLLETLLTRDKVNLDIFWVKDHALDDPDLLPPPDEVAAEIVESLETALDRFRNVAKALGERPT